MSSMVPASLLRIGSINGTGFWPLAGGTRTPPNRRTSGVGKHRELKRQMGRTWPETAGTAGRLTPPLAHTPVTYYVQYITLALRPTLTQAQALLKCTVSTQGLEYCWNTTETVVIIYRYCVDSRQLIFPKSYAFIMCIQYSGKLIWRLTYSMSLYIDDIRSLFCTFIGAFAFSQNKQTKKQRSTVTK